MEAEGKPIVFDVRFLFDASKTLHGYLLHTWFTHYLRVIVDNARRLLDYGAVGPDLRPSAETDYALLFDADALDLEKVTYVVGFYFYILSSHKKANYFLMQENDAKRVLYLRGFDYQSAVRAGAGLGVGVSSVDTTRFTWKLGNELAQGEDIEVFKALSPEDLYWETAGTAQQLFYGNFEDIIHASSQPIRSIHLNANHWKDDIAELVERTDYFVVYVSSITESVLWEIDLLERRQRTDHATVVFDAVAIANKELQTGLREVVETEYPDDVLWAKRRGAAGAPSSEELRERLARKFLVVSPDEFFAAIAAQRNRIAEAAAPVGPGAREAPLEFRFSPALDADGLDRIRAFDEELDGVIRDSVSSQAITNLPWFMNQVQLRIFTTLMLGDHAGTGRALAVYAAVADVVRNDILAGARPDDDLPDEQRTEVGERLRQHFEMAEYSSRKLLSYGQSHEFGDYRAHANEVYDETFAAASAAVEAFFAEADRRRAA